MNDYIKNEVLKAIEKIESIETKFNDKQELTFEELENLFLFYQISNNQIALSDNRFDYSKFRNLYLIYGFDLEFKSIFYKPNPNKTASQYIDLEKLKEINEKEYNPEIYKSLQDFKIINELIIPVSESELQKDKAFLENSAKYWADICLDERHSVEELKNIAKETRDTIKKKNIEDYRNGTLAESKSKDVFKGLLKSFYTYNESTKIINSIDSRNENRFFTLNNVSFEINLYSFIHIINRHYAEMLSSQSIVTTKSFHNTKINPYTIHIFIQDLISLIRANGIENKIVVEKGQSILIKFHGHDYALFFNEYKHDKSKIVLETFFIIESHNPNATRLVEKMNDAQIVELNNDLSIYIS
ncbi:hypothetical protein [Empedobacter brevis]|uniref:hypothetical protein n=1 Tax=Empedobacter brevis TaxID=247 RepID=UPI0039B087F5